MSERDDPILRRPIIVIGPPRSGTSLLLDVLAAHSELAPLSEPRLVWSWGNEHRSDLLRPEHARPEVRAHIRRKFAAEARRLGGRRIVEKTPSSALRPAFVDRVFPDCLFVNILRRPEDAVLSIRDAWQRRARGVSGLRPARWARRWREIDLRRSRRYAVELARRVLPDRFGDALGRPEWGPRLPGMQQLLRDLDLLEVSCLQWRMCADLGTHYGRRLPIDRYLELRLEDLSEEVLRKTLEFCGLAEEAEVWARFEELFDPDRMQARRRTADPEELRHMEAWIGPTRAWLGYPDPSGR